MAVTLRPATPDDADGLRGLLPRLAEFDLPPARDARDLWKHDLKLLEQWLVEQQADCRVHVAVDQSGQVCGLAIVTLRPELLSLAPSAHLEALAVASGFEGQGLGGRLLEAAEKDAREQGAESITLHVFAVNSRARALYEKAGFEGELMRYIKPLPEGGES